MFFTPKPPRIEARPFNGGELSALEIQGWMQANGQDSVFSPGGEVDGEPVPDEIDFDGKSLIAGQWAILLDSGFEVIEAEDLFNQYSTIQ